VKEWSKIPLELVKTGISGLDPLLNGGFIKGSTVLVSGNYGVGKTLFALEYAFHQARRGDKVLYVSTSEPVFKVRQFASNLEFYDDALVQTGYREYSHKKNAHHAGSIEFIESSLGIVTGLHFNDESSLIEEIRNMVEGKGIQHLIIDPITTITMLYESETDMRKDILLMGAWLTRLGVHRAADGRGVRPPAAGRGKVPGRLRDQPGQPPARSRARVQRVGAEAPGQPAEHVQPPLHRRQRRGQRHPRHVPAENAGYAAPGDHRRAGP
jgi:hypothetical protein